LSGYHSSLITTNEPQQCYVRLRKIRRSFWGVVAQNTRNFCYCPTSFK
jgi:hypothetical protein